MIETASNTVTATIPVGNGPFGVAVTPDGAKVYVANGGDGTVSVIATTTDTVTTTITIGSGPFGIAITPDGTRAYLTDMGSTISVIDTTTNTVVGTIGAPFETHGVAITPDGTKAYVANGVGNSVSVIDTATNNYITTIPIAGNFPEGIAVTPDGAKVYVGQKGFYAISVIDTGTNTVITTITGGNFPYGVAVTPDGAKLYVANINDGSVSVIATATNTIVATIPVGPGPYAFGNFIGGKALQLSFPIPAAPTVSETKRRCLGNTKCTPYNANIASVMDHSGTPLDPNSTTRRAGWYQQDGVVTAYTGETGMLKFGEDTKFAPGYKQDADGTTFVINGHYTGILSDKNNCGIGISSCPCQATKTCAPTFLNYDGHSGFDYPFSGANTTGQGGTTIVAPAAGRLYKAADDVVNISKVCDTANIKGWNRWHSFYIVLGTGSSDANFIPNGYSTWYLHADRLDPNVDPDTQPKGYAFVKPGDKIAYVGCYGPRTSASLVLKLPCIYVVLTSVITFILRLERRCQVEWTAL